MDRVAWWAIVHGVAKSPTQLRDFTFTLNWEHDTKISYLLSLILTSSKALLQRVRISHKSLQISRSGPTGIKKMKEYP